VLFRASVNPTLRASTLTPRSRGGKPIVRGMRISVELILIYLAQGQTIEAVLEDYPELEADDVRACLADVRACLAYAHARSPTRASTPCVWRRA
jgi:uncharacterized protein (DUF433 family)